MLRPAERLRQLHQNPDFAAARDERGRERFTARRDEMQRLSNAARRGVDVPPELAEAWKALERKRLSSEDSAALGLKTRKRRGRRKVAKPSRARRHGK